jgi:hypothetical protein
MLPQHIVYSLSFHLFTKSHATSIIKELRLSPLSLAINFNFS